MRLVIGDGREQRPGQIVARFGAAKVGAVARQAREDPAAIGRDIEIVEGVQMAEVAFLLRSQQTLVSIALHPDLERFGQMNRTLRQHPGQFFPPGEIEGDVEFRHEAPMHGHFRRIDDRAIGLPTPDPFQKLLGTLVTGCVPTQVRHLRHQRLQAFLVTGVAADPQAQSDEVGNTGRPWPVAMARPAARCDGKRARSGIAPRAKGCG